MLEAARLLRATYFHIDSRQYLSSGFDCMVCRLGELFVSCRTRMVKQWTSDAGHRQSRIVKVTGIYYLSLTNESSHLGVQGISDDLANAIN